MFSMQIDTACARFPINKTERYVLYPVCAIYSPIENLVRTCVGGIFTALSLASLGLCSPINKAANWTRYSRAIGTIPLQIIGNIFEVRSKILIDYNRVAVDQDVLDFNISFLSEFVHKIKEEYAKNREEFSDRELMNARYLCTRVFHKRSENRMDVIAKHIIFRLCSLVQVVACLSLLGIIAPLTSIVFIPLAIFNRRKNTKINDLAFILFKIPKLAHSVSLTLRMIVNPLQFVHESTNEREIDTKPIFNALEAPLIFWKNTLELQG